MKRIIIVSIILSFLLGIAFLLVDKPVRIEAKSCKSENAECDINNSDKLCCAGLTCMDKGVPSSIGKCKPNPTNTPTPTLTPTLTPTPTEEPEDKIWCHRFVEARIEGLKDDDGGPKYCEEELQKKCKKGWEEGRCPNGDPTPTVEPTKEPEQPKEDTTDHNSPGSYTPPVCTTELPKLAENPQYSRSGESVKITWQHDGSNLTKWNINYGKDKDDMPYGIASLPKEAREITLNGITWSGNTWVALCSWNTDSCQNCKVFDP